MKYACNINLLFFICIVVALFSLFISHFKKLVIAFIFLFIMVSANAQDYTISTKQNLLNKILLGTRGSSNEPEFVASNSIMSFSVPTVVGAGAGFFEWMVLGGRITGGSVDTESGHQASYLKKGNLATDTKSTIEITWEDDNYAGAWVAVRQTSEYGCSDGKWSIYYIRIVNLDKANLQLNKTGDACIGNDMDLEFILTGVDEDVISNWRVDLTDNSGRKQILILFGSTTHPNYIYKVKTTTLPTGTYTFKLSDFKILLNNSSVYIIKPTSVADNTGTVFALPPPRVIEHN